MDIQLLHQLFHSLRKKWECLHFGMVTKLVCINSWWYSVDSCWKFAACLKRNLVLFCMVALKHLYLCYFQKQVHKHTQFCSILEKFWYFVWSVFIWSDTFHEWNFYSTTSGRHASFCYQSYLDIVSWVGFFLNFLLLLLFFKGIVIELIF